MSPGLLGWGLAEPAHDAGDWGFGSSSRGSLQVRACALYFDATVFDGAFESSRGSA